MLFGHQDDSTQMPNGTVAEPTTTQATDTSITTPTESADVVSTSTPSTPTFDNNPLADETQPQASANDASESSPVDTSPAETTASQSSPSPSENDLLGLKQEALGHLTPLVNHLEQSPEEKFRTTMMMIQSTDNQALLKDAFEAAKAITDDKARAQALLDVINEINYFTQKTNE